MEGAKVDKLVLRIDVLSLLALSIHRTDSRDSRVNEIVVGIAWIGVIVR